MSSNLSFRPAGIPELLQRPLATGILMLMLSTATWLWICILAIPVWLLWTACGLGARYFSFLPAAWQSAPLPHLLGLFLLFGITRTALSPLKFELQG